MQEVNELYQDANNSECVDVHFKSSKIKLSMSGKSAGWEYEISSDHQMVNWYYLWLLYRSCYM